MKTTADELKLRVQQHFCHAETQKTLPWKNKTVAVIVNLLRRCSVMNKRGEGAVQGAERRV